MKSRTLRIGMLLAVFAFPAFVFAQASGLVPCGVVSSGDYSILNFNYYVQATSCNFCYLAKLIQNVVNFLVMVTIPISVAMFAWAGILFFTATGDPKRINRARSIFRSVFIGFIITISGWLVVQVVLQSITKAEFYNLNSWTDLQCQKMNDNRERNLDIKNVLSTLQANTGTQGGSSSVSPGQPGSVDGTAVTRATNSVELQVACVNNRTADCSLLQAVCVVESSCNKNTGCKTLSDGSSVCGMMQIKPETACLSGVALDGCSGGKAVEMLKVQDALNNPQIASKVAMEILNNANSACDGRLECMVAYYNGGPNSTRPSACCSTGMAYQCVWDCGKPSSPMQCDISKTDKCVQNTGFAETRKYYQDILNIQKAIQATTVSPSSTAF